MSASGGFRPIFPPSGGASFDGVNFQDAAGGTNVPHPNGLVTLPIARIDGSAAYVSGGGLIVPVGKAGRFQFQTFIDVSGDAANLGGWVSFYTNINGIQHTTFALPLLPWRTAGAVPDPFLLHSQVYTLADGDTLLLQVQAYQAPIDLLAYVDSGSFYRLGP